METFNSNLIQFLLRWIVKIKVKIEMEQCIRSVCHISHKSIDSPKSSILDNIAYLLDNVIHTSS